MKAARITAHLAGAGLFAGAVAWALHQQIQYVLAALFCGRPSPASLWMVSAVAIAIVLFGTVLSWLTIRAFAGETQDETGDYYRPRRFLAIVAFMAAALFLFAIMLQLAATFYLPLCTG
jgi:hypothetical protein